MVLLVCGISFRNGSNQVKQWTDSTETCTS